MIVERVNRASPQHRVSATQAYADGVSMSLTAGTYFFMP